MTEHAPDCNCDELPSRAMLGDEWRCRRCGRLWRADDEDDETHTYTWAIVAMLDGDVMAIERETDE